MANLFRCVSSAWKDYRKNAQRITCPSYNGEGTFNIPEGIHNKVIVNYRPAYQGGYQEGYEKGEANSPTLSVERVGYDDSGKNGEYTFEEIAGDYQAEYPLDKWIIQLKYISDKSSNNDVFLFSNHYECDNRNGKQFNGLEGTVSVYMDENFVDFRDFKFYFSNWMDRASFEFSMVTWNEYESTTE